MIRLHNTSIFKRQVLVDALEISDNFVDAFHRIGTVVKCEIRFSVGSEEKLALLISEMVKRGKLDFEVFAEKLSKFMKTEEPSILGVNIPCKHEWDTLDNSTVRTCVHCGQCNSADLVK